MKPAVTCPVIAVAICALVGGLIELAADHSAYPELRDLTPFQVFVAGLAVLAAAAALVAFLVAQGRDNPPAPRTSPGGRRA